ncbi:MAG: glycoside hydrolase family 43 protein [Spirochaetaceae bacterium]
MEKTVLITDNYTADPSAHVFEGKVYLYPSHDLDLEVTDNDNGDQYGMTDYHVYSMDTPGDKVTDHGEVLHVKDVTWASKQMWAPDVSEKDGTYYFYFPARDKEDIFRIGVAKSNKPYGPFIANPEPMKGSFSIDPAVFKDTDGSQYIYFGGLWGGQLQNWQSETFDKNGLEPSKDKVALLPRVAKLDPSMEEFSEKPIELKILDDNGNLLLSGNEDARYFEGPWLHKYNGKYYFSYSTGTTHKIAYAISDSPYGPFIYQGTILEPVLGWTTHHSIVEQNGQWYIFYHDTSLSGGINSKRSVKYAKLEYTPDGKIVTIQGA